MPRVISFDPNHKDMREAATDELKRRREFITLRDDYYNGIQRKHAKMDNGIDPNIVDNQCEIIVNSTADFVAGRFPEVMAVDAEDITAMVNEWWNNNDSDDWLLEAVTDGGIAGHVFARITEDGKIRTLDARNVLIWWDADDYKNALWYELQWGRDQSNNTTHRQDIVPLMDDEGNILLDAAGMTRGWQIIDYVRKGPAWEMVDEPVLWNYPLSPIVQWQHLPQTGKAVYGRTELPDHALRLQDAINKQTTDINQVFRYFIGPTTVITGARATDDMEITTIGGMLILESPDAKVYNVEMQSDLVAMRAERDALKSALLRRSRVVTLPDDLNAFRGVTNLGIRTLYMPQTNKANTLKRKYGAAIKAITKRMLMLMGVAGWADVEFEIEWRSALPTDERETLQMIQSEMALGILSRRMASEMRGRNYDQVREQLIEESMDQALLMDGNSAGSI